MTEPEEIQEGGVTFASFDGSDVCPMQSGELGERFLSKASLPSEVSYLVAKRPLGLLSIY